MADSVDEWMAKATEHEAVARALARKDAPVMGRAMCLHHAGSGIECALKALIMKKKGLNKWPAKGDPGNYWTHDLKALLQKAGLQIDASDPVAPAWAVVVVWTRSKDYTYSPKPTPLTVARSYVDAAYGPSGVMKWILSKLT